MIENFGGILILGRMFSVLNIISTLGMPLTLLVVPPVLDRYPASLFFAISGAVQLAGCLLWLLVVEVEGALPDVRSAVDVH